MSEVSRSHEGRSQLREKARETRRHDPHPLIMGLVRELPSGDEWTREKAENWLAVAAAAFEVLYDFEDEPSGERE